MTTKFNPQAFRVPVELYPPHMWWGQVTFETDPIRLGWRCRKVKGTTVELYVLGQRGKEVCASFCPLKDGEWDVAIYLETPKEVDSYLQGTGADCLDARYVQVSDISGFGFGIIAQIREDRKLF